MESQTLGATEHGAAQPEAILERAKGVVITQEADMPPKLPGIAAPGIREAGISGERVLRASCGE